MKICLGVFYSSPGNPFNQYFAVVCNRLVTGFRILQQLVFYYVALPPNSFPHPSPPTSTLEWIFPYPLATNASNPFLRIFDTDFHVVPAEF